MHEIYLIHTLSTLAPRIAFSRRPRFRGKGIIGGGVGTYTYEWVGEEWLATWLAEERVVEAILGESCQDADTAGATAAAKNGAGSQGGRNELDHQVSFTNGCLNLGPFQRLIQSLSMPPANSMRK